MTISPIIPIVLQNGTLADANQVMADFYQLQADVNANAAHNGINTDITALLGLTTPLAISEGGTGAANQADAFTNIVGPGGTISGTLTIGGALTVGGVATFNGATDINGSLALSAGAFTSAGIAHSGANSDITSLTGLTTPLPISEGGTGATTASQALINLGAASVANGQAILGSGHWNSGGMLHNAGIVTGVTRNSVGNYTIHFTAQPNANSYSVAVTTEGISSNNNPTNVTYTSVKNRTTTSIDICTQTPGGGGGDSGTVDCTYSIIIA